jgi:hypothetical protein
MTEEAKVETPAAEAPPVVTETKTHPPGYEPVDFDAIGLTPEQKAIVETRTRYLYHQVKAGKEERTEFRRHNDELQKAIDEQNARLAALEKDKTEDAKVKITQAIRTARDEGRVEEELELTRKLNGLDAPKVETPKANGDWWKAGTEKWAVETNDSGELKRQWVIPNHPDNARATGMLFKIKERWEQEGRALNQSTLPFLLTELDMAMGAAKPSGSSPAVLSTSQVKGPAPKGTELSQDEKMFADKTMQHVKDQAERYRRYATQRDAKGRK